MWEVTQAACLAFGQALVEEAAAEAGDRAYRLLVEEHFAQRSRFLAPADAGQYLGLTRRRVYDLTSAGALVPDGRDGRTPLFLRDTLDAYVHEQAAKHPLRCPQ